MDARWVVLKFGGTSVARPEGWQVIAGRLRKLLPGHRVWLVLSALSQVSNRLETAIDEALGDRRQDSFHWIRETHQALAESTGVSREGYEPVRELLDELSRLLEGVRLTREASPRLRAKVLAFGELASTRLGAAVLAGRGIEARWVDARDLLVSERRAREQEATRYLEAAVPTRSDPGAGESAAAGSPVVVTQGFIARTQRGETCLLGRGGSDTSAALFAALLDAERLEIWTDVHGMFTADPRQVPSARLIREIGYREAEELAAMGAKVLHPRCLGPVARTRCPLQIRNTLDPEAEGTLIAGRRRETPVVMAVVCRRGVTLLTVSTLEMWGASGFLARAFAPFEELGISVDLVATSQSAITVTLDSVPGGVDGDPFQALLARLGEMGHVDVIPSCAVVSVVGRKIRTVLHELGPALSAFREHEVHMVSESSEDLNLSFVVSDDDARPLVESLHARLFPPQEGPGDSCFGPTWEMLHAGPAEAGSVAAPESEPWWKRRRVELLERIGADGEALYVYDLPTIAGRATALRAALPSIGRFYYSMKANPHPRVVQTVVAAGFGLECVSAAEVRLARRTGGTEVPVLFTPNFCPLDEYRAAFEAGAEVTVDGPHLFAQAPELFRGTEVALRVDPGGGLGHHQHVRTAGAQAKFGHPAGEASAVIEAAAAVGARVVGLHAHVGSGIRDPEVWPRTARTLVGLCSSFGDIRWLDLGGGLAVVERPGQEALDLERLESGLAGLAGETTGIELRLEPGRYLVSEAGVLLARVTQVREKGGVRFVGLATGMNSLLRPALYGAWHGIHNLDRPDEPPAGYAHVVGPICETGDVLGRDRLLPPTRPGDVLLLANCGAYGAVMASRYNLREPAPEAVLE